MTATIASAGHVKGNRSLTVSHAPRYLGDRYPWTSERGTRYAAFEVEHTSGPAPEPTPAVRISGGETVRYEGSIIELRGTVWTAWSEPRRLGLLRLVGATGECLRNVRRTSVIVI